MNTDLLLSKKSCLTPLTHHLSAAERTHIARRMQAGGYLVSDSVILPDAAAL
jgi:hypothetical protein